MKESKLAGRNLSSLQLTVHLNFKRKQIPSELMHFLKKPIKLEKFYND